MSFMEPEEKVALAPRTRSIMRIQYYETCLLCGEEITGNSSTQLRSNIASHKTAKHGPWFDDKK